MTRPASRAAMIARPLASLALATLLAMPAAAGAADVVGAATGAFSSPTPPGSTFTGVGTSSFTWGAPLTGQDVPNQLVFTGSAFSANFGDPFVVGGIRYRNGTTALGTESNGVTLGVTLSFTTPALPPQLFDYALQLVTTPNTGDPNGDADFVNIPAVTPQASFLIGGTSYTLQLLGFQNVVGDGFLVSSPTQFHVREGGTASASLVGRVIVSPVPEPSTYALMAAGLVVLVTVARRRTRT